MYLFSVLSPGRVQALDEIGGVAQEEGVARRSGYHGEHRQPHVGQRLGWKTTVTYAQHVRHGLEQGPRVLLQPEGFLKFKDNLVNYHQICNKLIQTKSTTILTWLKGKRLNLINETVKNVVMNCNFSHTKSGMYDRLCSEQNYKTNY